METQEDFLFLIEIIGRAESIWAVEIGIFSQKQFKIFHKSSKVYDVSTFSDVIIK